jgi:NADPH:quinone reductase
VRAVVVHEPGGPDVLRVEERPVPEPREGWVLVHVRAFGLNRAELITRSGGSGDAVRFPRVIGIECVGEVVDGGGGDLSPGQTVVAAMGGMGRDHDGGYQEYALLRASHVTPVTTTLDWATLGALPETFGTAWGSLEPLGLEAGHRLLVRGGTSSVGMAAITLAHARGITVLATTRQERKLDALRENGAAEALIDDGHVETGGVDGLVELVGAVTILDSLRAVRRGGAACISGFLEDEWDTDEAYAAAERAGVSLTRFGSNVLTRDAYGAMFQDVVSGVESGRYRANLDRTFTIDEVADAHRYMESNQATGKLVVLTG